MSIAAISQIRLPFLMGNNLNAWSDALAGLTLCRGFLSVW